MVFLKFAYTFIEKLKVYFTGYLPKSACQTSFGKDDHRLFESVAKNCRSLVPNLGKKAVTQYLVIRLRVRLYCNS